MKTDRLVSIIMVLLERRKISASKLAGMFGVSIRTIYRDLDAINLAGIPIVSYPGVKGGVGIMEGYKFDKRLFTASDIQLLLAGLRGLSSALYGKVNSATLAKLQSLLPLPQHKNLDLKPSQFELDLTPWAGNKQLPALLEKIKKAMDEDHYIFFLYTDKNGSAAWRKIEPYQLTLKDMNWYVRGFCLERRDFRTFKLTRISNLTQSEDGFNPREFTPPGLDSTEWVNNRIITIILRIDPSIRDRIVDRCGEENITIREDNSLEVIFPFTEDEYGYSLLLSFGDKCECIGPERVRRELMRRIAALNRIYRL